MKNNNEGLILGLDVSTKTIGIALFDEKGDLKLLTHVTPKVKPKPTDKFEELYQKARVFIDEFLSQYPPDSFTKIIIEEPLLRSNNVNTVSVLLRFNTLIAAACREKFNLIPHFISSYDARKYAFPELMQKRTHNKKGEAYPDKKVEKADPVLFGAYPTDCDKKMIVWEKVSDLEPQIPWTRAKTQKLKNENFDMTDAYAAVRGHMNKIGEWLL